MCLNLWINSLFACFCFLSSFFFRVSVVKCSDSSIVSTFDLPKTALLELSPLNNVLVTWQPYSSKTRARLYTTLLSICLET